MTVKQLRLSLERVSDISKTVKINSTLMTQIRLICTDYLNPQHSYITMGRLHPYLTSSKSEKGFV